MEEVSRVVCGFVLPVSVEDLCAKQGLGGD
jgi:hypothetical protein